jgi:PIN domain nuclease of toxin-antitoxin system
VRLLLDTHIFLWLTSANPQLSPRARQVIESAAKVFVSSATIWEIAIKVRLGKLAADLDQLTREIEANRFEELPVLARQAKLVANLPLHHGDPFDRLLIAQAIAEPMHLLTVDPRLKEYSELVIQV